jgi:hypothetical protein
MKVGLSLETYGREITGGHKRNRWNNFVSLGTGIILSLTGKKRNILFKTEHQG